jgi:hypothetical protein
MTKLDTFDVVTEFDVSLTSHACAGDVVVYENPMQFDELCETHVFANVTGSAIDKMVPRRWFVTLLELEIA